MPAAAYRRALSASNSISPPVPQRQPDSPSTVAVIPTFTRPPRSKAKPDYAAAGEPLRPPGTKPKRSTSGSQARQSAGAGGCVSGPNRRCHAAPRLCAGQLVAFEVK